MPAPSKSQLEPLIEALMQANQLKGEEAPALAGAIAELLASGLGLFMAQAKVAPGIPCSPAATAAPGRLI